MQNGHEPQEQSEQRWIWSAEHCSALPCCPGRETLFPVLAK